MLETGASDGASLNVLTPGSSMSLNAKLRRELLARSHALAPVATLAAENVSAAAVEHVRAALTTHELIKVRLQTDDREACAAAAARLAQEVPCELVARVGRVVVLYRGAPGDGAGE